ncbi:hypothetical protein [Parvibaculum sp.]|uniref:hypothetical protein n=1 Tax=Parvibaculum sp. TaxID=2024848 RepID=UPI00320F02B6
MALSPILVTGGDGKYFPLIAELVSSIRTHPAGSAYPIGIIDAGLTDDQVAKLRGVGCNVVTPDWEYDFLAARSGGRTHLKAEIGKAFMPKYFPDHDVLVWIDADAWVQDFSAVELLIKGASQGKLAIVPQIGRYYSTEIRLDWFFGGIARVRSMLYKSAARCGLPSSVCQTLASKPTLNAGVFALRADAPHWARLRKWQEIGARRGRVFTSTQLALALAVYEDGLPVELMPETCNYMGPWRHDSISSKLVEYYLPNAPVGIVHLASENAIRADRSVTKNVPGLDNATAPIFLRCPTLLPGLQ